MKNVSSVIAALLWMASLLCAVVAAAVGYRNPARGGHLLTISGSTMGTSYTVKVADPPSDLQRSSLEGVVNDVLDAVNHRMSTYDPDSELARFNRSSETGWFPVSADTADVVAEALRVGRLTDGALDVTVGPLVNAWHFGPGRSGADAVPSEEVLAAAADRVGLERLDVRSAPPAVQKARADVYVDLSAVAKGFAVDRLADRLESLDLENYMIEVGGETRTRGQNERGRPWCIAIESPLDGVRVIQRTICPGSLGMATSGDYRNYFESDGVRYSHIIDPRTARPISHRLASVTVLQPSCTTADAFATALMVMGPDAAYGFAVRHSLPVLLLVKTADGFEERITPEFARLTKRQAQQHQ